ncbi:MAG: sugar phosphate isomerase/epimerase [Eubacteriales bacterium]|nr:sugar phosphate isomerase/epimerase [Eubacteriales bacterium]
MSIGIRLHDVAGAGLAQKAANAKTQGFDCAHVALSKVISPAMMEPAAATPGLGARVRQEMDGMEIAVLGCYLNLAHPDVNEYRRTVKKYVAHLQLSRWMGAGVVGTETGNPNAEYRYDPEKSHTEDSLKLFIDRLAPVVAEAEKLGAFIAIEPVYTHIVSNPQRARKVLDAIASPNLRIIFDPVNLLHQDNLDRRDSVLAEAMELLCDEIAVVHMKDYVVESGRIVSLAPGLGMMDYAALAKFVREKKPNVQMTLEDTKPDNAEASRKFVEKQING